MSRARSLANRSLEVALIDLGVVGDGSTNDTTAFQNAINAASATGTGTVLEGSPGKVYMCNTLIPKSNVTIDLRGSTIKLISGTNWMLFDGTGASGTNFQIKNGILDMNLAGNQINDNHCGGGVWLTGWQWLRFEHLVIQNAYRSGFVLSGCLDVSWNGLTFQNCGLNTNGRFSTCMELTAGTSRVKGSNLYANNIWGFGLNVSGLTAANVSMTVTTTAASNSVSVTAATGTVPSSGAIALPGFPAGTTISSVTNSGSAPCTLTLNNSAIYGVTGQTAVTVASIISGVYDIDIDNVELNNITQGGTAIGCTFTVASRCSLRNFKTVGVDGILVECNASSFITMQNLYSNGCNNPPMTFGDNGTGIGNTNIVVDNLQTSGSLGSFSMSMNFLQNSRFSNLTLDKIFGTSGTNSYSYVTDRNNIITDSIIAANISNPANLYYKWSLERVSFNNFFVERLAGNTARFSNAILNAANCVSPYDNVVATSTAIYVNLSAWNSLGQKGSVAGKIFVYSSKVNHDNTNSSYQEQPFVAAGTPAAFLGTLNAVDNTNPERITISANGTTTNGPGLTLTNSTGDSLHVDWVCELIGN